MSSYQTSGRGSARGIVASKQFFGEFVISVGTAIGGPLTGILLLFQNFKESDENRAADRLFLLGLLGMVVYYTGVCIAVYKFGKVPELQYLKVIPPIVIAIVYMVFQKRPIVEYQNYGAGKKSFGSAISKIILGIILEVLVVYLVFSFAPKMAGPKVYFGSNQHELYYSGVKKDRANEIAGYLKFTKHFKNQKSLFAKIEQTENGKLRLLLPMDKKLWDDYEVRAYYGGMTAKLSDYMKSFEFCFFDGVSSLSDSLCIPFASDKQYKWLYTANRDMGYGKSFRRIRSELNYYQKMLNQALERKKSSIKYDNIPAMFRYTNSGIQVKSPDLYTEEEMKTFGDIEGLRNCINIVANCFNGVKWEKKNNEFQSHEEVLTAVLINLKKQERIYSLSKRRFLTQLVGYY